MKRAGDTPPSGENVVIAGETRVLEPITVGDNSKVGAGAFALKDVPSDWTVVGVPGRLSVCSVEKITEKHLHHEKLIDPFVQTLEGVDHRLAQGERATGRLYRPEPAAFDQGG